MSGKKPFTGEIVGVLLRGQPYDKEHPLWSKNWIWLTKNQFEALLRDQRRFFWVEDTVFGIKDIQIAKRFSYEDLKKEQYTWEPKKYLLEALRKEKEGLGDEAQQS